MKTYSAKERREDFALQVVPDSYRQWSWVSLLGVLLGAPSAMFFLAWGGDLVKTYGTYTLLIGMLLSCLIIGTVGFFLVLVASESGLDMDLITSGSGFGYRGAGVTSLIYAISYFVYCAIEGSIIATAIHTQFPLVPLWSLYILAGLLFIPLTWYGLTALNYIMWISLPIYVILLIWSINLIDHVSQHASSFWSFQPVHAPSAAAGPVILQLLAATLPMISQATASADIGRFIPKEKRMISSIMMSYVLSVIAFFGATMLGAWFYFKLRQINPGIYLPSLLGIVGVVFVVLTQIRINALNTYAGSLALTTFFSRIFGFAPGRHWWVILLSVGSIALMFGDILTHLVEVMTFQLTFLIAWVTAVISYILFNKKLFKISPKNFVIQKGQVPDFDPIGLTALIVALLVAVPMALGLYGAFWKTLAPFVSGGLAFIIVPVMSILRKNSFVHDKT